MNAQEEVVSVSGGDNEEDISVYSSTSAVSPINEEGAGAIESSSTSAVSPFELYFEDQSKIEPKIENKAHNVMLHWWISGGI